MLEPLEVERTTFRGEGVETDVLRLRRSRRGDAGVPERMAGVVERRAALGICAEADLE